MLSAQVGRVPVAARGESRSFCGESSDSLATTHYNGICCTRRRNQICLEHTAMRGDSHLPTTIQAIQEMSAWLV